MTSDFLDELDAAVQQRCACPCGQPITQQSPSAYFAREACARRWHRGVLVAYEPAPVPITAMHRGGPVGTQPWEVVFELFAGFQQVLVDQVVPAVNAAVRDIWRQIKPVIEQAARLMQISVPPTDVMQRALELRRNRNTGPRRAPRVQRRVIPAGGLRAYALGRAAYRPAC